MLFTAAWHILPWWSWIAVVLAIAAIIFVPGAAAVFARLVATVVKLIPWRSPWTYVAFGAIAAVIGFRFWLDLHDQALLEGAKKHEAAAVDARDVYWKGREQRSNAGYAAQLASLQEWIDGEHVKAQARDAKLAADAAAERAKRQRAEDELAKGRNEDVTAEAARLCTLTRGVVLRYNAGAAEANGGDELAIAAARASGGVPRDAAAGVALDLYTRAVEDTQRALRACREQVVGWQRYHAEVILPWVATATEAVNRCTVKEGTP